jgi:hypothetical protein
MGIVCAFPPARPVASGEPRRGNDGDKINRNRTGAFRNLRFGKLGMERELDGYSFWLAG